MSPTNQIPMIRQFIQVHNDCHFIICSGYASCHGIARLSELLPRTNRVDLIIGDIREHRFKKSTHADRQKAVEFINRAPVDVYTWYRTSPEALAHGKAIIARRNGATVAALVGSSNITKNGFEINMEIMVRCHPDDHVVLDRYVTKATEYDPVNTTLLRRIAGNQVSQHQISQPARYPPPTTKPYRPRQGYYAKQAKNQSGCLPALAVLPVQLIKGLLYWKRSKQKD